MLTNYLKLAFRSLLKNPLFTALNVFGLALGLAVSLLLFLHVQHELSFDTYHKRAGDIHRVMLNTFWNPEKPEKLANAPNVVGPAAKDNIPAVEQYARLMKHGFGVSAFVTAGENKLVEEDLYWADPGLVDVFDIPRVAGDLKAALTRPNTVALSRSAAIRYFGTSDPVGQIIKIDQLPPLEVKAVYEDFPANSTLDAAMLGAFSTMEWANKNLVWSNASFETWLLLNPDANPQQVEKQLTALLDKNVPKSEQRFSMWLQPLTDVYLHSADVRWNYSKRVGDPKQVGILGALALAVLLIGCFNYMNLTTARSQLRFREVGINKSLGASRKQLIGRFYAETGVLTGVSLLLAVGLLALGIPLFNQLADKQLELSVLLQPEMLASIFGIGVAVILVAGSYPAFFLSAFSPKSLLQTSFRKNSNAGWLRRSLVTAQFTASVVLIIGTLVLYRQMQFIQQKNLGFEPKQVVAITTIAAEDQAQLDALIQGCRGLSNVESVCRAQTYPGANASGRSIYKSLEDENGMELRTNRTSPGIEKVLGITLLAGASLPEKQPGDTIVNVILTKTAVDYLGLTPEAAIGKKVYCDLGNNAYIRGVTEDFHSESLHKPLGAYAFHDAKTEDRRFLLVKLNTQNLPETMRQIETVFKSSLPQSAFEYKFIDDYLDSLYRAEARTASVVFVFSLLSVLISCLGLFGLAAFAAEQRTKEIGIRRVLGASVAGITGLLSKDFLKLVVFAIAIASPLAYFLMDKWLADFAYRIEIQWWMFVVAGVGAVVIAFLTVGFQSVKAALANPVKSLRSE
jgi:putative ABC transport system permease protein